MYFNKQNLLVSIDIDGTIANVGSRFINCPPPEGKGRGDIEYELWLDEVQRPEVLMQDKPVMGMQQFVSCFPNAVYVTSRHEKLRKITEEWLRLHNFPELPLLMRNNTIESSATLKSRLIKEYLDSYCIENVSVIICDDDPLGNIENMCHKNKWVFLKSRSGGAVL